MKKDNYKTEFEEHRKEIFQDSDSLPSRAELHRRGSKPKKKSSHLMINIVLGLFTLIPVIILVYVVSDFYNPGSNPSAKDGDAVVSYEETENKKPDEQKEDIDQDVALDDEDNKGEEKVDEVVNHEPESESEKNLDEKPEKPVVDVNPTPEKEAEGKTEQESTVKTHKVANGETLYRISVNYYGSDAGIEKIKNANGLTSNDIMVGQTLTIP
ncbi:LysM peptidoglycan-binding domain-containing protein [Sporosarcina sp. FSL K6-2383]|uniref:LysM peptidoglycan-binding domain-containing protein n=1 Tax=Sporosarcina sp. FSL K6-2383 TaxID=2921556 RepID=UPI00315A2BDD